MKNIKTEISKLSQCKLKIKIQVEKNFFENYFENCCVELQRETEIPGFRKGTVPIEIIKKRFSEILKEKTISKVINETLPQILKENNLNYVADTLKIEKLNLKEDNSFEYEATLEVEPEVKLKSYKGLKLKKEIKNVTQKDIDKIIEQLKENNAKLIPSEKNVITEQDILPSSKTFCVINYKIFSDGKEMKNLEGKNVLLNLAEDNIPKSLKEGMVGMEKGSKKLIRMEQKAELSQKDSKEKQVDIEVELVEIKQKILPEFNDDFAKDLGYNNKEELLLAIKNSLKEEFEKGANQKLKKQIYETLIEQHDFPLPETEVKNHYNEILDSLKQNFISRGGKEEDFKLNEEQTKNLLKKAQDEIKLKYILKKIIQEEKIEITKELLEKEKGKLLALYPGREKEIDEYFEKNFDTIASNILEEKLLDVIISNAKIKEVDVTNK